MKIDLKQTIEQGGLSKQERLKITLQKLQEFYLDELIKTKESLENISNVINTAPDNFNGKRPSSSE